MRCCLHRSSKKERSCLSWRKVDSKSGIAGSKVKHARLYSDLQTLTETTLDSSGFSAEGTDRGNSTSMTYLYGSELLPTFPC